MLSTTRRHKRLNLPPGPRGYPVIGVWPHLLQDAFGFLQRAAQQYGDIVYMPLGTRQCILMTHPRDVKYVMADKAANYPKQQLPMIKFDLLGWRHLIEPGLHRHKLNQMVDAMTKAIASVLQQSVEHTKQAKSTELYPLTRRLAIEIASKVLLGTDISHAIDKVIMVTNTIAEHFDKRLWRMVLPTRSTRRFRQAMRELDAVIDAIIEQRRNNLRPTDDILSMLLVTYEATPNRVAGYAEFREIIKSILVAGYIPMSSGLAWTWYLLAQHPEVEEKICREVAPLQGRTPSFDDLAQLPYTALVVMESMRFRPPTWLLMRRVMVDDEVQGYRIPAGATVLLSPYFTQHRQDTWEAPERFMPERFQVPHSAAHNPFAYFPFGGGPRFCPGRNFALQAMILTVAMAAQQYRIAFLPGQRLVQETVLTLTKPGGYLPVAVHRRHTITAA